MILISSGHGRLSVVAISTYLQQPGAVVDFSGVARPRHHHAEIEFNLGVRGRAVFGVANRRIELRPGRLVWFLPFQDHVLEAATPDFQMWIGAFKPSIVDRYRSGRHLLPSLIDHVREIDPARSTAFFALCRRVFERAAEGEEGDLVEVLERALAAHVSMRGARVHPAVAKAMRRLEGDPSLGRDELSRAVGLVPEALSRAFMASVGLSLPEYRNRLRLGRFVQMLENGERNLLHAALESGFGSYPQFHRVVREQTGQPPSAFAEPEVRRAAIWRSIPFASLA